ncbi:hypothetical protein PGIGA_G00048610 [Pangasianodon gigas]|uniref:Uncharacterized protein n=1 Tax=Pangasianodon gigas TaxID=30993 RepID=A0ACC5X1Q0_PANGG|nr:hypothetical protein [Pangasianodon gigas]
MAVVTAMLECLTLALAIQPSAESILPLFKRAFFLLSCTWTLLWFISAWVPCHLIGTVLVSLPALSIFSHITCDLQLSTQLVQRVATSPFFQLISLLVIHISPVSEKGIGVGYHKLDVCDVLGHCLRPLCHYNLYLMQHWRQMSNLRGRQEKFPTTKSRQKWVI